MAQVSLQNVRKIFPRPRGSEVVALAGLNLEIGDREFLVLAGPGGAGKTTLLRLITGLEPVSAGEIRLDGRGLNTLPPAAREVAMIFPNHALYPQLTVQENLAFGLKRRKQTAAEIQKRIEEAAEILELASLLALRPDALNGEQSLRVALGRALARRPKLFLFDDPLAALDPADRAPMRARLRQLHERLQATMLFATSDATAALTLGPRVAILQTGTVVQEGAPLELARDPAQRSVAEFLGTPPMNFLTGTLKETPAGWRFREKGNGVIDCTLPRRETAAPTPLDSRDEVVLGLRPEALTPVLQPDQRVTGCRFQCLIDSVEAFGPETHFHLATGAHSILCRSWQPLADPVAMGHRGRFEFDPARALLFDSATGRRLA